MGCWNYPILCDDTALDALDELAAAPNHEERAKLMESFLDEALACAGKELDYDKCQYGLVAAAITDVLINGLKRSLLVDSGDSLILSINMEKIEGTEAGHLREKSLKMLGLAVSEESELKRLWEENEELYPSWLSNLNLLHMRLSNPKE